MKNVMSIDEMEKKFGSVEFEGAKYILIQDAYINNRDAYGDAAYFANAVKVGDTPDEGHVPIYTVEWEIINPETEDEADACDWDTPDDVRDDGATLNLKDGYIF